MYMKINNKYNGSNEYEKAIKFLEKGCNCGCSSRLRFLAETASISSRNCPNTLGKNYFFISPNYFLLLAEIGRNYFKVV